MAIVGVPGWIGSSAVNETGQRWMSAAGAAVRRPAPFYMSQLANQSKFNTVMTIGSFDNESYGRNYGFLYGGYITWFPNGGGALSPDTIGGQRMCALFSYGGYVRTGFMGVGMLNRNVRVMIEGLGTYTTNCNQRNSSISCWGEVWLPGWGGWLKDRIGGKVNVLVELL